MRYWKITNRFSGLVLGIYGGEDEHAALDTMARDAGYADHAASCEVVPMADDELIVEEVDLADATSY